MFFILFAVKMLIYYIVFWAVVSIGFAILLGIGSLINEIVTLLFPPDPVI